MNGGPRPKRDSLMRGAARIFLLLVAVNAAVGITVLIVGEFGQTQGKVFATSLLATAGCVGVLINVPAIRRAQAGAVPGIAAAMAVLTAGLLVLGLWAELDTSWFGKLASSSALATVAGTYAGLMSLLPVRGRQRLLLLAAYALAAIGTVALLASIWLELDSAGWWRIIGVGFLLLGADTLALPVIVRQTRPPAVPTWHCPRCGADVPVAEAGERVSCSRCLGEFAVFDREVSAADRPAGAARPPTPPPDRRPVEPAAR